MKTAGEKKLSIQCRLATPLTASPQRMPSHASASEENQTGRQGPVWPQEGLLIIITV